MNIYCNFETHFLAFRFQLQLKKDQQGALKPDATSEFKNYKDAIKRLIKYHVWQEKEDRQEYVEQGGYFVVYWRYFLVCWRYFVVYGRYFVVY